MSHRRRSFFTLFDVNDIYIYATSRALRKFDKPVQEILSDLLSFCVLNLTYISLEILMKMRSQDLFFWHELKYRTQSFSYFACSLSFVRLMEFKIVFSRFFQTVTYEPTFQNPCLVAKILSMTNCFFNFMNISLIVGIMLPFSEKRIV